jgi:cytochrome b pre-mRNA-processing protein 3
MGIWTLSGKHRRGVLASADRLHASAVTAARALKFYTEMGAPDSIEGRFELLTLHVILLVERLRAGSPDGEELRQALFDTYVSHLDGAMREMGVGDLAMGKRMRKLGEAFYGRAAAYATALAKLPELKELESILSRTVLEGAEVDPASLAAYIAMTHVALAECPLERLWVGEPAWVTP